MKGMWSFGGLSLRELLRRTAKETWQDDVFGVAARLAFYHFLAIFPLLLLLLFPLVPLAATGAAMRRVLSGSFTEFLPREAAAMVTGAIGDLNANAHTTGFLLVIALASAVWAGVNAAYAMIQGLNKAYETEEDRSWWRIVGIAAGLAFSVLVLVFAALLLAHFLGRPLESVTPSTVILKIAQWLGITGVLLIAFALFYRFGPNLKARRWEWSTPGAVFSCALWIGSTLLIRFWFDTFASHDRVYGRASAAALLLFWLYVTSASVLIGAELNSEIEKAHEESGSEQGGRRVRRGERERADVPGSAR